MKGDWLNPAPIFFSLIGRLLDIFTTIIALESPLVYETNPTNPLGIHVISHVLMAVICSFLPQLIGLKWKEYKWIGVLGSYVIAILTFIPVINNLEVMRIAR